MFSLLCTLVAVAAPMLAPPVSRPDPLRTEVVVEASLEEVWQAWTTEAGLESWLAPAAEVELRPGGRYATNAIGKIGEDGTIDLKVLAYEPQQMLAYTTTAPGDEFPQVAVAGDTWAVVTFRALDDDHTLVQHSALGWRDGDEWDRARAFFTQANRRVLDMLRYHFQRRNVPVVTRVDRLGSFSRQFETAAPPKVVWEALTTPAGLSAWLGAAPEVDLSFDGSIAYSTSPGSDPIVERVLAFDPERVLATRLDLPESLEPAFGAVEQTWTVTRLEPLDIGGTRVTRTSLGWQSGKDWDAARRFFETQTAQQMRVLAKTLGSSSAPTADSPPTQVGKAVLDRMSVLAGKWTAKVSLPDGSDMEVHAQFHTGPDGRSIVSNSAFLTAEGQTPHTAALTWLEPGSDEVRFVSLDQASQVARGTVVLQGDTLVWDWEVHTETGISKLDVRVTLSDDDHYRMVVRETEADRPLVDTVFTRVSRHAED